MATNNVFTYSEDQTEVWTLTKTTAPGTFVIQEGVPAVTLVGTEDYTITQKIGPLTISGIPRGGASIEGLEATVAKNGTWDLPVEGADGTQAQNTQVYATSDGTLTLTGPDNQKVGKVNLPRGYAFHGNILPVQIGVTA